MYFSPFHPVSLSLLYIPVSLRPLASLLNPLGLYAIFSFQFYIELNWKTPPPPLLENASLAL